VHAISLATASLTSARGRAADSWNPRVHMKEENVSLRGEIALLRERKQAITPLIHRLI
jgi:hypothetical protein